MEIPVKNGLFGLKGLTFSGKYETVCLSSVLHSAYSLIEGGKNACQISTAIGKAV